MAFGRKEARDPRSFDLNDAVRGLESVLRRFIDEHIDLALNLSSSPGAVEASQPALEEALVQLTVAASSALPAGGRIEIAVTAHDVEAARPESADGAAPGRHALLSITASGWGLDADVQEQEGLASARRTIDRMGGHLAVKSSPGSSLTFNVRVPRVQGTNEFESEEFAHEVDVTTPSTESVPGTERVEM